jgi:hypothetical protein
MEHKQNYIQFLNDLNKNIITGEEFLKKVNISEWKGWNMIKSETFEINPTEQDLNIIARKKGLYPNYETKTLFFLPFTKFNYLGTLNPFEDGFTLTYILQSNYHTDGFRPNQQEVYTFYFSDELQLKSINYSHATYREIYQDFELDYAMRNG